MIEFAKEWIQRGSGISTFARALNVPASRLIVGTSIKKVKTKLKPSKDSKTRFVALTDIPALLAEAERDLLKVNPHPEDRSLAAVSLQNLERLPVELVRTPGRQQDVDEDDLQTVAEEERAKGAAAAAIVDKLSRIGSSLSGEQYVKELSASPDGDLTRAAIKVSRKSTPSVSLGPGQSLGQGIAEFPFEVPCEGAQIVSVKVSGFQDTLNVFSALIVDAGEHQDFWQYFHDRTVELEVIDDADKCSLLLARAIDFLVKIEITPTVVLPRGQAKHDRARAALSSSIDHSAVAAATLKVLKQQLKLDF